MKVYDCISWLQTIQVFLKNENPIEFISTSYALKEIELYEQ